MASSQSTSTSFDVNAFEKWFNTDNSEKFLDWCADSEMTAPDITESMTESLGRPCEPILVDALVTEIRKRRENNRLNVLVPASEGGLTHLMVLCDITSGMSAKVCATVRNTSRETIGRIYRSSTELFKAEHEETYRTYRGGRTRRGGDVNSLTEDIQDTEPSKLGNDHEGIGEMVQQDGEIEVGVEDDEAAEENVDDERGFEVLDEENPEDIAKRLSLWAPRR